MRARPVLVTRSLAAAVLPLMTASSPAAEAPVRQIVLASHHYAPAVLILRADTPVTLQFVNRAGKAHDFTAPRFFASARIVSGEVEDGEVDLGAGESRTVTLVPARGEYQVRCTKFLHRQLGMRGRIVVE